MKVVVRETAEADARRIFDFIAQDNPAAAGKVIARIGDAVRLLASFPYMARVGRVEGTREWVVRGLPYIVIYTVDDARDELTVVSIVHGARDR